MKISRRKLHQENEAIKKENPIKNWLAENADPAITKTVKKNLAIANRIGEVLKKKGLKPIDLATKLGKNKSEISKWLSGQHNFTTKTICKIEVALECDLISVDPIYLTAKIYHNKPISNDGFIESKYYTEQEMVVNG